MEFIKNQPIMKPDFGGSFEGTYKINLTKRQEYEVDFIVDLSECLACTVMNDKIMEMFYKIQEAQRLPPIAWITIRTIHMSIRLNEENFNKAIIQGEGSSSMVMDVHSDTPYVGIHFLTKERPSMSNSNN